MNKNYPKDDLENILQEVLTTEPDYNLTDNFAEKLTAKIVKKSAWKQHIREFLIYLIVITSILLITWGMMALLLNETWTLWVAALCSNMGIVIGSGLLLVFILFADKVVLKSISRNSE